MDNARGKRLTGDLHGEIIFNGFSEHIAKCRLYFFGMQRHFPRKLNTRLTGPVVPGLGLDAWEKILADGCNEVAGSVQACMDMSPLFVNEKDDFLSNLKIDWPFKVMIDLITGMSNVDHGQAIDRAAISLLPASLRVEPGLVKSHPRLTVVSKLGNGSGSMKVGFEQIAL